MQGAPSHLSVRAREEVWQGYVGVQPVRGTGALGGRQRLVKGGLQLVVASPEGQAPDELEGALRLRLAAVGQVGVPSTACTRQHSCWKRGM